MQILSISDILRATDGELIHKADGAEFIEVTEVTIDSRKAVDGVAFIPLKGEHADGHDFIGAALEHGASVALTEKEIDVHFGNVIKVKDTRKALGDIARYYKQKYPVPTVSITGSVGKTTTKDLVYAVISEHYKTHKTPNNFNNDIGVPLTIFGLNEEHTAAVIEMGMNHLGEISYLANIVRPECAIITNIGMSHIENLGSREGIFRAKMEIAEKFGEKNTLIVNGDDDYLKTLKDTPYKLIKFGMSDTNDLYAKDIVNNGLMGIEFTVVYPDGEFRATVKQPGVHNVYNALAAVAAGFVMGVSVEECKAGLYNCVYTSSRLEVIEHNGIEIINDCYNASPDSVRAALKVMEQSNQTRKVAVLGDIFELGEHAETAHFELGKSVGESCADMLITAGENARLIAEGAKACGMDNVVSFDTTEELCSNILNLIQSGDCVLIKASHGMKFSEVTEKITNS